MLLLNDSRRKFLEYFHPNKRSAVSSEFLTAIRAGEKEPTKIVTSVLQRTLPSSSPYNQKGYIAETIQKYMQDAIEFATHCFEYENLPDTEKETIRQARKKESIRAFYMAQNPPTEPQLRYLQFLGYLGEKPGNKAEASQLIDHILNLQ